MQPEDQAKNGSSPFFVIAIGLDPMILAKLVKHHSHGLKKAITV